MHAYRLKGRVYLAEDTKACPLYSRREWVTSSTADWELDEQGRVTFQGRVTGETLKPCTLPKWAARGEG